ncbi:TonB-dependent receptor [Siccirubricoccus deserti]|uniref:TonB-dependent siderophore receptor n=1 Tax=Siccirubricoccus deserti TaxID=2013562 RepID=A0A9X0QUD7_9PROT|nr:TonB-dependent siderophore receptor [Siccirubricoccus deserti]MBC4013924.1 TonB-dependent siderophore receptor [Siccirubricoccus deserti]
MSHRLPPRLQPTLGLAGLSLLGALPAAAQTPPAAIPLPEIGIAADAPSTYRRDAQPAPRLPTAIADTPQTINVVPRELIDERAGTTLREALRNVTGISLVGGEGGASGDNLTLRGFSARGDFFIEGLRDSGQYTRDPFYLDSIEVLKGPSSIQFGRGSTGGVINQTLRLPQARNFGELSLQAFSPGGVRATSDVNLHAGNVAVRLNTMAMTQQIAGRDHVENKRYGVAPSITWGLGTNTQLTVHYLHQYEENIPDYGVPWLFGRPAPVNRSNFYGTSGVDHERLTTDVLTARVLHRFSDAITLRNTFRFANYDRDLDATAPRIAGTVTPSTPLSSILVNRQAQFRDATDTSYTNLSEAVLNFRTGILEHSAIIGVELSRDLNRTTRYAATRPSTSLLFPNFYAIENGLRTVSSRIDVTSDSAAVFAVDQIKLGEMFEILVGGRFDHFSTDYRDRLANTRLKGNDNVGSYRAALVFKPFPGVRTYFSTGTSFNPSGEFLTLSATIADLAPERNQSYELGASWEVTGQLELRGALFRLEKENARTTDPATGITSLAGNQRVDGFEVSALGRITRNWNLLAGYTFLDGEIVESNTPAEVGRRIPNTPRHTATVWTTYDLPYDLQLGGGAFYVDSRFSNTANTNRAPGYTRWDAAIAWQPREGAFRGLRLQANALNLTDRRYYDQVTGGQVVPGAGRTFLFTVGARF